MEESVNDKTYLGFWTYLMTDLLMFAGLFATFTVLRTNTFGGPTARDVFHIPYILVETIFLLLSSFFCGLAVLAATRGYTKRVICLLVITFLLGGTFLGMEIYDFHDMFVKEGTYQRSAFLSSYTALVGTHGLHITFGLFWMSTLIIFIIFNGLTKGAVRKLTLFSLFWHFLDLVWIFIFTIVYLWGVVQQ